VIPNATYRLQLNGDFTFAHATRLVPYLARLGISHVYASPILAAQPGSKHGYDTIDYKTINPELGGESGLRALVVALRAAGLGLIVDFVPNHMFAGPGNSWWDDVLRHGRASPYAMYFDIDWNSDGPDLKDKVLLPILGRPYGEALAAGDLKLEPTADDGGVIRYFDRALPVAPESMAVRDAGLPALLDRQHYRLAWWRAAADQINWRRFFDISDLVGLRQEEAAVFDATHATLLRLYAEGLIDGVRLDHVDGLADPGAYCRKLRARLAAVEPARPASALSGPAYLVVEKILGRGEQLPSGWLVDGAIGYDFMNEVSGLFHDPAGEAPLTTLWTEISGRTASFDAEETQARGEIRERSFAGQFEALVSRLAAVAGNSPETRDIGRPTLRRCLAALLAKFRVYRTYPGGKESNDRFLDDALRAARPLCFAGDGDSLDLLGRWLRHGSDDAAHDRVRTMFQQLTAPLAAKSVEDTAFYRYGRLLSRNDVGFDAARFAIAPAEFHAAMRERLSHFPHALLETATHDHKRGEDVRARLAVLSELAPEWREMVRAAMDLNAPLRRMIDGAPTPSPGDEYMLYQTIVGAWPTELTLDDAAGCETFAGRLLAWQQKAAREAKLATDWTAPNEPYEQAARDFLTRLFAEKSASLALLAGFAWRIGPVGAVNGLSQLLLKLTAPGVPDLYQGTEFWDLSLMDPDNRRPVDYAPRLAALDQAELPLQGAAPWRDGRFKLGVIARCLTARNRSPALFAAGDYQPLAVTGAAADHVMAFARRDADAVAIVVVTRSASHLLSGDDLLEIARNRWRDTRLEFTSKESAGREFEDVLGGGTIRITSDMPIGDLLRGLPIGLFIRR